MSSKLMFREVGWSDVSGAPKEIGLALGSKGRDAAHRYLTSHALWNEVSSPRHAARVVRMAEATRSRFPSIWAELEGLAQGLDLPLMSVFAWNCRGDLIASVPDGCTTVMIPGAERVIAHNEDGLPLFRGACFIARVLPDNAPGFHAFCYPGSIPGHTFAFNSAGLVQTVNNLRLTGVEAEIPRMVLGRAILSSGSLDQAVAILENAPSGGFHFTLGHTRDSRIVSVEFGGNESVEHEITRQCVHANHAIRLPRGLAGQIITQSSADRQTRGEELCKKHAEPLMILRDVTGDSLPIRRSAEDDPDEENTLGTAVFALSAGKLYWSIYDGTNGQPAYSGTA